MKQFYLCLFLVIIFSCKKENAIVTAPLIESISPSWGFAGDTVEIVGSGFGSGQGVSVMINSTKASIVSVVDNKIKFLVPSGSGGLGTVSVTANGSPSSNSI